MKYLPIRVAVGVLGAALAIGAAGFTALTVSGTLGGPVNSVVPLPVASSAAPSSEATTSVSVSVPPPPAPVQPPVTTTVPPITRTPINHGPAPTTVAPQQTWKTATGAPTYCYYPPGVKPPAPPAPACSGPGAVILP